MPASGFRRTECHSVPRQSRGSFPNHARSFSGPGSAILSWIRSSSRRRRERTSRTGRGRAGCRGVRGDLPGTGPGQPRPPCRRGPAPRGSRSPGRLATRSDAGLAARPRRLVRACACSVGSTAPEEGSRGRPSLSLDTEPHPPPSRSALPAVVCRAGSFQPRHLHPSSVRLCMSGPSSRSPCHRSADGSFDTRFGSSSSHDLLNHARGEEDAPDGQPDQNRRRRR